MKWEKSPRANGRMEWLCEHGIGHGNHIHGCDGCCSRDDFPGKDYLEGPDVWESMDGRRTRVKDLGDEHLVNIVKFLRENVPNYKQRVILNAGMRTPDMDHYELKVAIINDMTEEEFLNIFSPIYKLLLAEVFMRGLIIDDKPAPDPREYQGKDDMLGKWRIE